MPNSINRSSRYHSESSSGFTMIELMVTIVVLGVILSIAAPSISTQLANQRVKSTTATLINALREAKAESVIRRQPVTVIYINDAESSNISIQVPAPLSATYLSPTLFPSAAVARDWTSLFISSAVAANGNETQEERACRVCELSNNNASPQCNMCNKTPPPTPTPTPTTPTTTTPTTPTTPTPTTPTTPTPTTTTPTTPTPTTPTTPTPTTPTPTTPTTTPPPTTPPPGSGVQASNLVSIAAYKYSAKTLINSNSTNITFYPSKRIDKDTLFTYTICDSNQSVSPRQVMVNALGVISSKLGGTC